MTTDVFSPQRPEDEKGAAGRAYETDENSPAPLHGSEHELERLRYQQPVVFLAHATDESHQYLLTQFSSIYRPVGSSVSEFTDNASKVLHFAYRASQMAGEVSAFYLASDPHQRLNDWEGSTVFFLDEPVSSDELRIFNQAGSALESKEIRPEYEDDE